MSITFTCECGKNVQVGDEYAGQEGQCPSCRRTVRIPGQDGQFTATAPARPANKPAPWDEPPRVEPLPEPDDLIGRLTSHAGVLINEDDDFFVSAPPEIGRLYSAFTTLKRRVQPMRTFNRVALVGTAFVVSALVAGIAMTTFCGFMMERSPLLGVGPALCGTAIAGAVFWWTRFRHSCNYVGTKGIAHFECAGERDRIVQSDMFLFAHAAELRIGQTRHYYNGVYTGTQYTFTWTNERGDTVHTISGNYKSEEGNPPPTDAYHYALMAENAWTMHLLRDIERILSTDELLFFGLKGGDYIELGRDVFVLVQGGKAISLRGDQIAKMTVGNGVISIWEVGAKEGWFVNQGIYQFMYHDLGNARFFLFAIEKLLGIRF